MKRSFTFLLCVMPVLLLLHCSARISGTETGNPGMTVCARAALELLDTIDKWSPVSYLVDGIEQLDPGYLNPSALMSLGKTAVSQADSSDSSSVNMTHRIITVDTVYVSDTIIQTYTGADTVVSPEDSTVLISGHLYLDSIFVVDTVVVFDTLFVAENDTGIDSSPNDSSVIIPISPVTVSVYSVSDTVYYSVMRSKAVAYNVKADAANLAYRYDSSLVWISRNSSVSGMAVCEEYRDGDGDGILYLSKNAASPASRLKAAYTGENTGTELSVYFDAGSDAVFSTVWDNRIYSLRRTVADLIVTEEVLYGNEYNGGAGDTLFLTVNREFVVDSIRDSRVRYGCLPDPASGGHTGSRLSRVYYDVNYRTGLVKKINMTITLDNPLAEGEVAGGALFEAYIYYGKGLTGEFTGTIDYGTGIVSGIYAEGGIEYSVDVDGNTGKLTQTQLQPLP